MLARIAAFWRGGARTTVLSVMGWAALELAGMGRARADVAGVGLSSGYRPVEGLRFRKLERSAWDLQVAARIEYQRDAAFLVGPALSLTLDSIHLRSHEANGTLSETIERKARVRPALVLGMLGGPIVLRVVASPFADAEARLDLGFEADAY